MFTAFFAKYQLYLILAALMCGLVGANVWYIKHLQSENKTLKVNNTVLNESLKASEVARVEAERRDVVADQVTVKFDTIRKENKARFDNQRNKVDQQVRAGQDRPVGPLLEGFFNEQR